MSVFNKFCKQQLLSEEESRSFAEYCKAKTNYEPYLLQSREIEEQWCWYCYDKVRFAEVS